LKNRLAVFVAACGLLSSAQSASAILINQIDTFHDGTRAGWDGGITYTNVATGGPAGDGDRYFRAATTGSHMGTRNDAQWSGDYLAAGVSRLEMDFRNEGTTSLSMRVMFLAQGFADSWTSTTAFVVPADGHWHHAVFEINPTDLTNVGSGLFPYESALANVTRLLIRHDPGSPSGPTQSVNVTASLGIDNIRAVPEPGSAALLTAMGLLSLRRRARK
jgi:hypothetical protein